MKGDSDFKPQFDVKTKFMATILSPTKKLTPFLTTIKLVLMLPNYEKITIDSKVNTN